MFTRAGGAWTQQGAKLSPSDENGNSEFGSSVALSADGNTALIGGPTDSARAGPSFWAGAAWVYTRADGSWTQGPKLIGDCTSSCAGEGTGEIGEGNFGNSVALSADGNSALIGAWNDNDYTGAAWLFTHSGRAWAQQGQKLTAAGQGSQQSLSGDFGLSVALSAEGITAFIGSPGLQSRSGTAWVLAFPPIPTVTGVQPSEGPAAGGTPVTITGTNLTEATTVDFGTAQATEVEVKSATEATAVSPPGTRAIDVTVSTPERTSPASAADQFTYETPPPTVSSLAPSEGSALGGTTLTIKGTNLASATEVTFGSTKATAAPTRDTTSEIEVQSPPHVVGTVDVTVRTAGGVSATSGADRFTYTPPMHLVSVSPQGAGVVSASSGAIQGCASDSGTCSGAYEESATVVLTATPAAHNRVSWEGCTTSSGGTCTIVVGKGNVAVKATFTPIMHTLTVGTSGGAGGTVTSVPADIDCGTTCSAAFAEGTQVTLTATPSEGAAFDGWSGGGCSGMRACVVLLGADETITAAFAAAPSPEVKERERGVASASRLAPVTGGRANLKLSCKGEGSCEGTLELAATITRERRGESRKAKAKPGRAKAKTVAIGHAKYKIAKRKAKRVEVKLNRSALRLLKRHGRLVVRLSGTGIEHRKLTLIESEAKAGKHKGRGKGGRWGDHPQMSGLISSECALKQRSSCWARLSPM